MVLIAGVVVVLVMVLCWFFVPKGEYIVLAISVAGGAALAYMMGDWSSYLGVVVLAIGGFFMVYLRSKKRSE